MKRTRIWIAAAVFFICFFSLSTSALAQWIQFEVPEVGLTIKFPENFYVTGRVGDIPSTVPGEYQDKLIALRENDPESYVFALSGDGKHRATLYACETPGLDYAEMAGDEFYDQLKSWERTAIASESTVISNEPYRSGQILFVRSEIKRDDAYFVSFTTVEQGKLYTLIIVMLDYAQGRKTLTSSDESICNGIADSIAVQTVAGREEAIATAAQDEYFAAPIPTGTAMRTAATEEKSIGNVKEFSLTFTLPGNFIGMTREQALPGRWRPLFEGMQPGMQAADVYYYAIRMEKDGRISQMAVTGRNAEPDALQAFFDAGTEMIDNITGRTGIYREKEAAHADDLFYVNNIVFKKIYRFSGAYSWMMYIPERKDIPFAFAYAADGTVITAAGTTDMDAIVKSFAAKTVKGDAIPGQMTATEYVMGRFYLTLACIMAACVLAAVLVVVLRYRNDKRSISGEHCVEEEKAVIIKRLRALKKQKVITEDEFLEKKNEINERLG